MTSGLPVIRVQSAEMPRSNVPDILQLEPLVAALPAVAGRPGRPRRKPGSPHGSGLVVFRWVSNAPWPGCIAT
jgi:hypothetical protein